MHPLLVKLGGAVITDKSRHAHFRRAVAKRLLNEVAKADAPVVLLHGAGSFGHPIVRQYAIGDGAMTDAKRDGVGRTMAAVASLHAQVLLLAADAGLRPVSVPLHLELRIEDGTVVGVPVGRIEELLREGHTPVLHGTLARDADTGWRVVSADELMAVLAEELDPRLALFVTDVDGVLDGGGVVVKSVDSVVGIGSDANGDDVTGAMHTKVRHGLSVAASCPTFIINGTAHGRVADLLAGKDVPGTRLVPPS